jgi:hypothetical protein
MKPSNRLLTATACFLLLFTSCKKESSPTNDPESAIETTFELTADQASADLMTEDDNDLLSEAAEENQLLGNFVPQTLESNNLLACATITVTPQNGFPKTILVDFGPTNCIDSNGVSRRGKIRIVISDTLRRPGSTAVMTFDGYYVNEFKREGTHTWANTSQTGTRSWVRKVENGKITAPGGRYWLHQSVREVVQTAGVATPRNLRDDIFSITGNATVTNPAGINRTSTILQALQKKYICPFIDKGRVKFQGPNHFAVLDYGNGDCDRFATMSIDGRAPRIITLR